MSRGAHEASPQIATPSQTVGPFFHFGLATDERLGQVAPADAAGERIHLRVRVLDGDGRPVPDALIELYQADAEGRYAHPWPVVAGQTGGPHAGDREPAATSLHQFNGESRPSESAASYGSTTVRRPGEFSGFGRLPTDGDGLCVFDTIRPGVVTDARGNSQAPHINVCLFARGLLRHICTRIYFTGDSGLSTDPLLALVPPDRRETLMATRSVNDHSEPRIPSPESRVPTWIFTIRLQGANETVFFDL